MMPYYILLYLKKSHPWNGAMRMVESNGNGHP